MQGIRSQARGFALQLLYQVEVAQAADQETLDRFWLTVDASRKVQEFAQHLVQATLQHQKQIDKRLTASLESWKLSRLTIVVRNVLRLAVCEMLVLKETPPAVVMNEAIELTRSYMDEESVAFVNSVLEKCRAAEPLPAPEAQEEPPPAS